MNLFIFGIILLGSSVQPQNTWAYKQEVTIADEQKGTNLRLLQMNRISATKPAAPLRPIKPRLPIATPIYKPVVAPKKPAFKPSSPKKPVKPVKPLAKPLANPTPPPFNGGINTPIDWYCGNETEKTCSSQTCSVYTGCSQNTNNYRSCLFECIGGTFA